MSVRSVHLVAALALSLVSGSILADTARAEDYDQTPDLNRIYQHMQSQDARIRELESRLQQNEQPLRMLPAVMETNNNVMERLDALEASDSNSGLFDEGGEDTHGEKWSHKWGGRIMGDYVNWMDQTPPLGGQDYFEFRRLRLFVEGEGYGVYDYKLQLDFEPENSISVTDSGGDTSTVPYAGGVAMKDLWLGIKDIPLLGYVRFGHYKAPFSIEELTSSKYITFMERALPNVFSPGREVGVTSFNVSEDEYVTWAVGCFFDDIDEVAKERVDDNQGVRVVGRATCTPYYDELAEGRYMTHLGICAMYTDDRDNSVRFRSRPEIHEGPRLVDSGTVAADDYTTLCAEAAWVHGPLSIQSEFMWVNVNTLAGADQDYYGAYAYLSYFFTGEHRPYERRWGRFGRIKPLENFWIVDTGAGRCVGRGAWEGTVRWSYLDLTDGPSAEQMHDLTVGFNWYWNPYTRMMFNYIHAFPDTPAQQEDADILGMRLQVDF